MLKIFIHLFLQKSVRNCYKNLISKDLSKTYVSSSSSQRFCSQNLNKYEPHVIHLCARMGDRVSIHQQVRAFLHPQVRPKNQWQYDVILSSRWHPCASRHVPRQTCCQQRITSVEQIHPHLSLGGDVCRPYATRLRAVSTHFYRMCSI